MYFKKVATIDHLYHSNFKIAEQNDIFVKLTAEGIQLFSEEHTIKNSIYSNKNNEFSFEISNATSLDHLLLGFNEYFIGFDILKHKEIEHLNYAAYFPNSTIFYAKETTNSKLLETVSIFELVFCLIEDLYNKNSDFHNHSFSYCDLYKKVFNESKVFEYINKKRLFYKSYYEFEDAGKPTSENNHFCFQLKKNYTDYLELLIKDEILLYIPHDKLTDATWILENPENELFYLSEISNKYKFLSKSNHKIEDFLLKKHDIEKAASVKKGNSFFKFSIFQGIATILALITIFNFWYDKDKKIDLFETPYLLSFGFIFIASIFYVIYKNKNHNLILIRLVLSIITSWLLIVNLIDFTASLMQLSDAFVFFSCILISILTLLSMMIEINVGSKYHPIFSLVTLKKVVPLFIYAFNISFFFGIIFHSTVTVDFVKKTKIFPKIIQTKNLTNGATNNEINTRNFYISELTNEIVNTHPDSILKATSTYIKYFKNDSVAKFNEFNQNFIKKFSISDTVSIVEEKLYLNKSTTFIFEYDDRKHYKLILFYRMFLIQLFLAIAFAIVVQSIVSKETITEPI